MRTLFILSVVFVTAAGSALAQQPAPAAASSPSTKAHASQAPADGPPSPDQVLKLLGLLRVREELQITLDAMKRQVQDQASQAFGEKVPDPTPQQIQSVHSLVDEVFRDLSMDDLIRDLVPVYQRHLTQSDVRALIAFYSSPPGQKILREQPAMIKESMKIAGAKQQKRMEVLLAKLEVRMQQLVTDEQNKPSLDRK